MITNFPPEGPLGVVIFILAIAVLIIVHEIGHFVVARLLKVEVEEFGLGFPPRMLKLFEAKGTVFSLNWIPLGGFVRPKGENDPNVPGGLAAANPWVRIAVLFAGPAMNFLLAIILLSVIFSRIGEPVYNQVIIINVAENSPAAQAGLLPDDLIVNVQNKKINSTNTLFSTIYAHLGEAVDITYLRDGETFSTSLIPRVEPPEGQGAIGIIMGNPRKPIKAGQAFFLGLDAVYRNMRAIVGLPGQIIRGAIPANEGRLVGFKGMYDMYSEMQGIDAVMNFFASISVSLGLLNLFPIPGLDGGRILFVLPEILIRKRIPQRYEEAINLISIGILLLLMFYVNIQDFINPANFSP